MICLKCGCEIKQKKTHPLEDKAGRLLEYYCEHCNEDISIEENTIIDKPAGQVTITRRVLSS